MKSLILLLIAMSAAGTFPFIIYIALSTIFDNYISARFRYRCLKYCLLLYLVPFPLLKYFIYHRYFSTPKPLNGDVVISLTGKIVQTSTGFYLNSVGSLSNPEIIKIVEMLSQEMQLQHKVTVYENSLASSPFTYGTFHPSIVLTSLSDKNNLPLIIRHELQHIKSHDFLFRQLAFLVLMLHCYNHFVYFFFREVIEVQELACDENVMKYLSREEQRCYGYLLIMTAAKERAEEKSRITLMFSKNNRIFLKRRVKRIGIFVKPKIALNVSIIIFMISISCIPVFAYNPPTADLRSVPWTGFFDPAEGAQVSVFDNGNEIECITFEDESSMIPSDEIYFKDTENYFITDNGDIIIIEPGDIQTYAGCSHIFVNGKHKNHSRNKNGGCTVKTYKGKICTKCNYTKDFSLDSTVTYSPCPH